MKNFAIGSIFVFQFLICSAENCTLFDSVLDRAIHLYQCEMYDEARRDFNLVIRQHHSPQSTEELYLYIKALWYDAKCAKIIGFNKDAKRNCCELVVALKFFNKNRERFYKPWLISDEGGQIENLEREIEEMRRDVHQQAPDFWEDLLNGNIGTAIRKARKWERDDRELAEKEAACNRKKNSRNKEG